MHLPDDVLADVLGRLPPLWLAAARCVRKSWRRVIDDRRLLRSDLLPLSLAGIIIQFEEHAFPEFFARPSSSTVNMKLDFLPLTIFPSTQIHELDNEYFVWGHCNGLLWLRDYVVNPATRRWDRLPSRCPTTDPMGIASGVNSYLAFDQMVCQQSFIRNFGRKLSMT
jgi:hypothetical protein